MDRGFNYESGGRGAVTFFMQVRNHIVTARAPHWSRARANIRYSGLCRKMLPGPGRDARSNR